MISFCSRKDGTCTSIYEDNDMIANCELSQGHTGMHRVNGDKGFYWHDGTRPLPCGSEQTSTTTPISTCPQCEATNGKPKCVQIFGLNNWIDEQYKLYIKANESHIPIGTEKRACTFGFALWLKNSLSQPSQNGRPLRKNPEGVATCGDAGELSKDNVGLATQPDGTDDVKDAPQKGTECGGKDCLESGCRCIEEDVGGAFVVDDVVVKRMVSGYCNTLYSLGKGEGASPKHNDDCWCYECKPNGYIRCKGCDEDSRECKCGGSL